ncbi:hypothetical protein FB567DRAFT_515347 [Paraphoma chrysanthemicola]|uniref:F-box domain-containing protein n=1 Tax=Paraphoma chrysanthemicola TaxID=798071 RepID=A0A8K0W470_9PLEO|nr:hypothetical protein FB567DRAFT_515347 [Paraphoma chrysanthemicola]
MPGINHESYVELPSLQWAATHPRKSQVSPFLTLPGELRNKIYQHCMETRTVSVRERTQHDCSEISMGDFKSLFQASRQLRVEFKPLYLENTVFEVSSPEACVKFAETYFPHSRPAVMEEYRGNMIIAVPRAKHGALRCRFDVGSILRRAAVAPRIGMRFELRGAAEWYQKAPIAQLNSFIDCIQDKAVPKWRELTTTLVFGVEFFADIDDRYIVSRINFFLKDFEEVKNHKDSFFQWWSSVSEPPNDILELLVSWGYAFDGRSVRPLESGSGGKSLDGERSKSKGAGGKESEVGDFGQYAEIVGSSGEFFNLRGLLPTLERGAYRWNA